jgi:uncharacterized membrane protein
MVPLVIPAICAGEDMAKLAIVACVVIAISALGGCKPLIILSIPPFKAVAI